MTDTSPALERCRKTYAEMKQAEKQVLRARRVWWGAAYDAMCVGYTHRQIADAVGVAQVVVGRISQRQKRGEF